MTMTIKLFAVLKEIAGQGEIHLEVPSVISCGEVVSRLHEEIPSLVPFLEHCLVAVNGKYADDGASVSVEDEVAFLPPVSGG